MQVAYSVAFVAILGQGSLPTPALTELNHSGSAGFGGEFGGEFREPRFGFRTCSQNCTAVGPFFDKSEKIPWERLSEEFWESSRRP